jgi:glycosyltransferase involved in cell wall biosynthesis
MVSIITPVYNAGKYIDDCIRSVISQSFSDWELIIVNDGSSDASKEIILSYNDSRIRYFEQKNSGASIARNKALKEMRGNYFCFLDADDLLPVNSISSRIKAFEVNGKAEFIDGQVLRMTEDLSTVKAILKPGHKGPPLFDLVHLTGRSFKGLTWMIKRNHSKQYKFKENLSHAEDLLFLMSIARDGSNYDFIEEPVLLYRNSQNSAMKDIIRLEEGYRSIESEIKCWNELQYIDKLIYRLRWRKFMALDYLKRRDLSRLVGLFF